MTTSYSHVLELLPGYVLGCLDQDDFIIVSEHLADCAECRAELDTYQTLVDHLALVGPVATPSPNLKKQLQDRIQSPSSPPESNRPALNFFQRMMPLWATLALILIILLSINSWFLWQRVNQLEAALLRQPNLQSIALSSVIDTAPEATGVIVLSSNGWQGTLVVDGLPLLDKEHQYQLWLIQSDTRDSGAVFSVDDYGYGTVWVSSPQPLNWYSTFGISIEPTGGSPGPTGEQVLGGHIN